MENPIKVARQAIGWSMLDLALAAGVDYSTIAQTETGHKLKPGPAVLAAFGRAGYDPDALTERYTAWRRWKASQITSRASGQ